MPARPIESMPQHELLLRLRYAIDTATKYPSQANIDAAVSLANDHPRALRTVHLKHNLGGRRWEWLDQHGITAIGESVEIAGSAAIKGTITPEVVK